MTCGSSGPKARMPRIESMSMDAILRGRSFEARRRVFRGAQGLAAAAGATRTALPRGKRDVCHDGTDRSTGGAGLCKRGAARVRNGTNV
jgi:hypothetical protein